MPKDMASFITSYLLATEEKTLPTWDRSQNHALTNIFARTLGLIEDPTHLHPRK